MQMAELLVSHGASLSARTSLDEMPIGEFMKLKERNGWSLHVVLSEALTQFRSYLFRIKIELSLTAIEVLKLLLYYRKCFFLLIKRRKKAFPKHQVFLLCVFLCYPLCLGASPLLCAALRPGCLTRKAQLVTWC